MKLEKNFCVSGIYYLFLSNFKKSSLPFLCVIFFIIWNFDKILVYQIQHAEFTGAIHFSIRVEIKKLLRKKDEKIETKKIIF